MADREKVIYSIERCICHVPDACRDCAYDAGHPYNECVEMLLRDALSLLKAQEPKTIDANPVVHGRWVIMGGMKPPEWHHHHQCSVCESYAPMRPPYGSREELPPWCPACGAKMDIQSEPPKEEKK